MEVGEAWEQDYVGSGVCIDMIWLTISYQSSVLVIVGLVPFLLQQFVPSGEDWPIGPMTHLPNNTNTNMIYIPCVESTSIPSLTIPHFNNFHCSPSFHAVKAQEAIKDNGYKRMALESWFIFPNLTLTLLVLIWCCSFQLI